MAVSKAGGATLDFAVKSVQWDTGKCGTGVLLFEEGAEVLTEERFNNDATGWALAKVCFAFGVEFARAARDGLSWVDFVVHFAHWQHLMNELSDELFPSA
jgi:hypothetical protein